MMLPFCTLPDQTEIVHSEMDTDGIVRVYVEKPDEKDCFHFGYCTIPGYMWSDIYGFSEDEIVNYEAFIRANANRILCFAKEESRKYPKECECKKPNA